MNRVIVLDTGPVGMFTNPNASTINQECYQWMESLVMQGAQLIRGNTLQNITTWILMLLPAFPQQFQAAAIAIKTVQTFVAQLRGIEEVIFCCFSTKDLQIYEQLLSQSAG